MIAAPSLPILLGFRTVAECRREPATVNLNVGRDPQLMRMFAAWITGAQRAISAAMWARNSAGELPTGSMNWAASLLRTAGVKIAVRTSRWIFATTVSGVRAGAINPFQASASTSMPPSLRVGMAGRWGERAAVETASIFSWLLAACGVTEIAGRQPICTSPRMIAVTAAGDDG